MEIDIKQVLLQIANFSVLMFIMNKYLYKPVLKVLKQRENKINDGLSSAEKNIKAEEELGKAKKSVLSKARREAAKILSDAKADAKTQSKAMLIEAKKQAKDELAKQEKKAQQASQSRVNEQDSKLAKLTMATVETLLRDSLSAKDVERITKETIKNLR